MSLRKVFQEDDALLHDPTYPGIRGWWKKTFRTSFDEAWKQAAPTEKDFGDYCERTIEIEGTKYIVLCSFDGYSVAEET